MQKKALVEEQNGVLPQQKQAKSGVADSVGTTANVSSQEKGQLKTVIKRDISVKSFKGKFENLLDQDYILDGGTMTPFSNIERLLASAASLPSSTTIGGIRGGKYKEVPSLKQYFKRGGNESSVNSTAPANKGISETKIGSASTGNGDSAQLFLRNSFAKSAKGNTL